MKTIVKVKDVAQLTHNVKRFTVERPDNYEFTPGQATHVSINKEGWEEEDRAFTFTCLPDAKDLEFTIKIYPDHNGVTDQLNKIKPGDELILREVNGAIEYKGPGYFIAGGAGITPFIAIFRELERKGELDDNILIFSNKTDKDIILKKELDKKLGHNVTYVITNQDDTEYTQGYIDEEFLRNTITDLTKHFYVCGPKPMTKEINKILEKIGATTDELVFEQ
ncbi:hypothetical protein SAMN05216480_106160 [Pustulibacterium marinum]|uniref:FAD-binding FR-type domain-containing protein n=1 Tax=Pustulibacterium marinum TaxID=1224947 RepID=A0A1I7H0J5_9FLAO|nr:FAD-binding oxidoreductase [Pustulibacterium marinum]SFU54209.1 hypothetical protein SAMN05216480_106160 [Pustulibacterium marinum]